MTCTCDYAPKTFHCPYCKRDVCLCEACYLDDNTPPLCMWCADTANDWPAPQRELLRRELAYYQSGKAEDAEAIDELLVRPSGLEWSVLGRAWFLNQEGNRAASGVILNPGTMRRTTSWLNSGKICELVHEGSQNDCARALVEAVTK